MRTELLLLTSHNFRPDRRSLADNLMSRVALMDRRSGSELLCPLTPAPAVKENSVFTTERDLLQRLVRRKLISGSFSDAPCVLSVK